MQRSEWLMFFGTFLFGMIAGIYVYFVGFAPLGISAPDRPDGTGDSFTITAEERGICSESARGCGSYRVRGNREYRFIRTNAFGEVLDTQEGLLSVNLFDPVVDELNLGFQLGDLDAYPSAPPICADENNEIRYRVEIADYGTFFMASCVDVIDEDDELLRALENISRAFPF